MASETDLREWRKCRRQSQRRLHPGAVFGAIATLLLVTVRLLVGERAPAWLLLVLLMSVWFQPIGDWINVRYLDRRIAEAEREQDTG